VANFAYSGVVGAIQIRIHFVDPGAGEQDQATEDADSLSRLLGGVHSDYTAENRLRNRIMETRSTVLQQVQQTVSQVDRRLEADSMVIRQGSVEVLVIISTAYAAITSFNDFIDVMYKTTENVRRLFRDVATAVGASRNFVVTGHFTVDPQLQAATATASASDTDVSQVVGTHHVPPPARPGGAGIDLNTALLAVIFVVLVGILGVLGVKL